MEIGVRVEAEPWNVAGQSLHVASAYLVFVAIDAGGNPRDIPPLLPEYPGRAPSRPGGGDPPYAPFGPKSGDRRTPAWLRPCYACDW